MSSKNDSSARSADGQRTTASTTNPDSNAETKPEEVVGQPYVPPFDPELEFGTIDDGQPSPKPQDPAALAATIMLEWALLTSGLSAEELRRPGTVSLVSIPTADWAEPACDAWTALVSGQKGTMRADRLSSYERGGARTVLFVGQKAPAKHERERNDEVLEDAMWRGYCVVGFTPESGWLPVNLVTAADHWLHINPLLIHCATELALRLTGTQPTVTLTAAEAAAAGPRLLRLARRPEQTADAYLTKLRELVQAAVPLPPAGRAAADPVRDGMTLQDLAGMDEAVAWGEMLRDDLTAFREKRRSWADVDRGVLLSGPPGCGKTTYAQALARTCGVPLVQGSWSRWLANGAGHQGDFMNAMKKTFAEARERVPCIVFLDEVDSFPNRATLNHSQADWDIQCVNALLAELDGVQGREGVVVVAACNNPHLLDPALTRSGRLDRHVRIGLPDVRALERIMRVHLRGELGEADLGGAALLALDSSGADVERIVRGARRRARKADRPMEIADLLGEIGGADERTPDELARCAVHEAGHAVVSVELGRPIKAVSIRAVDRQGGALHVGRKPYLKTSHSIHDELVFLLAGRAAEQVVLGEPSSGAGGSDSSDLALATRTAMRAACELGLDGENGLLWHAMPDNGPALSAALRSDKALAERVRARLDEAYRDALAIIDRRRSAVLAVSAALLTLGVLDGDGVAEIMRTERLEVQP